MASKTVFVITSIVLVTSLVSGTLVDTLKECCDLGTNYASSDLKCSSFKTPIGKIPKEEEPYCLNSITMCCKAQVKLNECNVGLEDAKSGDCIAEPGSERKQCCEACNIGKFAGQSGQTCSAGLGLGAPYDTYYKTCCEEVLSTSVTPRTTSTTKSLPVTIKTTTVARDDPLPSIENLCDIDEVCAQICIPTNDSYRCDCHDGYTLMADQISCKEIKKPSVLKRTNRCEVNNPCDHNCVDTGIAIYCTCKPGYELAKDKRSCIDIDECARDFHTCLANEICINGEGYYDCERYGDEDSSSLEFYDKECPEGYKLNGEKKVCDDIDECKIPLICEHGKTCINSIGSYECSGGELNCPPGYYYKQSTQDCSDIDECLTGQHDCNIESEVCLNTKGNFTCISKASKSKCPPGFKMNLVFQKCEDIDECVESPDLCPEDQSCKNEPGGHTCIPKYPYLQTSSVTPSSTQTIKQSTQVFTTPFSTTPTTTRTTTQKQTTPTTTTTITTKPTTVTSVTTPSTTTPTPTTSTTSTVSTMETLADPVYPTFNPKKPEMPTPVNYPTQSIRPDPRPSYPTQPIRPDLRPSYPTQPIRPDPRPSYPRNLVTTMPTNPKPLPPALNPVSTMTCQRGYRYIHSHRQCLDINECVEDPEQCDKYEDCFNTPGSYICNCKIGFTRDPMTAACVDINECQLGSNDCTDGQRCDNTVGSYLCSRVAGCGTGYTLNYASGLCEDDDECLLGTHSCDMLGSNLVCRNIPGSYRCDRVLKYRQPSVIYVNFGYPNYTLHSSGQTKKCLPGYYMDAHGACQDINECESNPCKKSQKCKNLKGRYECVSKFECKGGYELNEIGDKCVDINECTRGTHSCSSTQICKNHIGYYICLCPPGHKLISNECVDINECDFYKDRICSSNSYCVNTIGSYKCKCKKGFKENGNRCDDIDECAETPYLCHQKCVNVWGGYRCTCDRGFTLNSDNRTCTDIDECETFKDKHLCIGTCENTPGSYVCKCPSGYKLGLDGRTCQDIDECDKQQPCHGRDTICFNTRGGYECPSINCPPNYIRDPDHKSRCKRDPIRCSYMGSCSDTPEQYTYHFFNLISNIPMVHGPIKFFQMKGPLWDTSSAKFNLKVENVRCPSHVQKVNSDYFRVNREARRADISFVRSIEGPQQVELSFEMQLFANNVFTGRVIAKIFIYVSQYSF